MSVGAPLGRDEALPVTPIAPKCAPTGRRGSVDAELFELVAQGAEGDAQGGGGLGFVVAVFLQGLLDGGAFDLLDAGRTSGRGVHGEQGSHLAAGRRCTGRRSPPAERNRNRRSEEQTSELQYLKRI